MKRTEVKYRKMKTDSVLVLGINNCASMKQIEEEFGYDIKSMYIAGYPRYLNGMGNTVVVREAIDRVYKLKPGLVYTKSGFAKIIHIMKQSGERLHELTQSLENAEIIKI